MTKFTSLIFLTILFTLAGCYTPKKMYPAFYEGREFDKVSVSADATLVQDKINEKKDAFVAPESENMLNEIHLATVEILSEKGYQASNKQWRSTGLSIPANYTAFVVNDAKEKSGPDLNGPHTLHLNGRAASKVEEYAVERLFERMLRLNLLHKETPELEITEISDLPFPKNEYICVVSGFARNVHTGKQIAQATAVAIVSLGTVVIWEPDLAVIKVALIDPNTRKIVWANQTPAGANTKSVRKALDSVLKDLPDYSAQVVTKKTANKKSGNATGNPARI